MNFIENIKESKEIPRDRIKTLETSEMMKLTSKINLSQYNELRNKIYWASELLYKNSYLFYFDKLNVNDDLKLDPNDMILTYPLIHISSELCKLFQFDYLYTTMSSILLRQIIEHYCLSIECRANKVPAEKIFKAAVCSHNKHVGASIEGMFNDIRIDNTGLFKVIEEKVKLTKLAKKHNYEFAYKLFSGDSHLVSTIEKLTPTLSRKESNYEKVYLQSLFSFLCDINEYYLCYIGKDKVVVKDDLRIQIKDK